MPVAGSMKVSGSKIDGKAKAMKSTRMVTSTLESTTRAEHREKEREYGQRQKKSTKENGTKA